MKQAALEKRVQDSDGPLAFAMLILFVIALSAVIFSGLGPRLIRERSALMSMRTNSRIACVSRQAMEVRLWASTGVLHAEVVAGERTRSGSGGNSGRACPVGTAVATDSRNHRVGPTRPR